MSNSSDYINNYINQIIISPLARIMEYLALNEYDLALSWLQSYLPPLIHRLNKQEAERFQNHLDEIKGFYNKRLSIKGKDTMQSQHMKQAFTINEAPKIAYMIYEDLWPMLYQEKVFEFIKAQRVNLKEIDLKKAEEY